MARRADAGLALVGIVVGVGSGIAFATSTEIGVVYLGVCLLLAVVLVRPVLLAVIALVGTFAVQRLGGTSTAAGSGSGISYSDAVLVLAAAIAVPSLMAGPQYRRLRTALVSLAAYLVCLLPTVLLDDSSRGPLEWGHRLFLVGGALLVGAWIAREGVVQGSLRALLAVACVIAVLAMLNSARNGFAPASPLGLNKNFVGALLSIVVILSVAAPREVGLHLRGRVLASLVIAGGLVASQSRGSMIAAAVGILIAAALEPRAQGRQARGFILVLTLVLAGFAFFSVRADFSQTQADFDNGSIGVRRQVEERTLEIWRTSPIHGVGLKYFNSGEYGALAQPANIVVDNELAESGIIGLAGYAVLQGGVLAAGLRRRRGDHFVVVGTACVAAALAHGLVDIYWTAGTVTLPFIIMGMALGSGPPDQSDTPAEPKSRASALAST